MTRNSGRVKEIQGFCKKVNKHGGLYSAEKKVCFLARVRGVAEIIPSLAEVILGGSLGEGNKGFS